MLGHPVKDASGNPKEFVGTLIDVTEQMHSRKALEDAFAEINRLKDQLFAENIALRQEIDETSMFDEIVEKWRAQKVPKEIETVGPTESTVLIYGETGTGKEPVARAIHNLSARRSNAFVKVNCAAIPTGLLESDCSGTSGARSLAQSRNALGALNWRSMERFFLMKLGKFPWSLQPKLLRVLQEREFERLGSSRTRRTDARLIAATNRDLSIMVGEEKFRSDLFYCLNVFPIHVPAPWERPEDIPIAGASFRGAIVAAA